MDTKDLFKELAEQEADFTKKEFFSPAKAGQPIKVRIANIVMTLRITRPRNFEGWGVFRPTGYKKAVLVREATLEDREGYLQLFPAVRVILCAKKDDQWLGLPGNAADSRFKFTGLLPVMLPVEPQMFDMVVSRFDGKNFWYEGIDAIHSPQTAEALRDRLVDLGDPKNIRIPGITMEEREAYTFAYAYELEARKDMKEERIKEALQRGGGVYRSYIERGNSYTVSYEVDGERHHTTVNKDTLSVESAGICLTDHATGRVGDTDFDLQSLVGVIREGMKGHLIHRW